MNHSMVLLIVFYIYHGVALRATVSIRSTDLATYPSTEWIFTVAHGVAMGNELIV